MSRFFGGPSDSEESGSDEPDETLGMVQPMDGDEMFGTTQATTLHRTQFAFDVSDSDSDSNKRVVLTRERRMEDSFRAIINAMKNHLKINDWVAISKGYDSLVKNGNKWKSVIEKAGVGVPRFVVRMLVQLEKDIQNALVDKKAGNKKFSTTNARSLNKMKQRFRRDGLFIDERMKYMETSQGDSESEGGKSDSGTGTDWESEAESGDESGSEEESEKSDDEDSEDSVDEEDLENLLNVMQPGIGMGVDFDEADFPPMDDIDRGSDESSDEDASDKGDKEDAAEEEATPAVPQLSAMNAMQQKIMEKMMRRDFWVKKEFKGTGKKSSSRTRKIKGGKKEEKKVQQEAVKVEYTEAVIRKKLKKFIDLRGRLKSKIHVVVEELELMLKECAEDVVDLKVQIYCLLLSILLDSNLNKTTAIPLKLWTKCVDMVTKLMTILTEHPEIRLMEADVDETLEEDAEEEDNFEKALRERDEKEEKGEVPDQENPDEFVIKANVFAFITRLNTEFKRSLQEIELNDEKYEIRLKDLTKLQDLHALVRVYYKATDNIAVETRLVLLQLSHLYGDYIKDYDAYTTKLRSSVNEPGKHGPTPLLSSPDDNIDKLCQFVYLNGDARQKAHVLLMRVSNYAIHGRYYHARDLLLMSHLNETVGQTDVPTRILFNRAQAHLALCAFRYGFFRECMDICAELYHTGHIKECLAQGVSNTRWSERDPKQETIEKKREYPAHQHINLDLLESTHLISAMFLEVPNLARNSSTDRRHILSRNFRRLWDNREKQLFAGPPENTRDCIMAAAQQMARGEWKDCQKYIMGLKMWALCTNSDQVKELIRRRIQEMCLETYLLKFGSHYSSLSVKRLSEMFELSEKECYRLVSTILVDPTSPLRGSWDQPSQTISIYSNNPTPLQKQALEFADKIAILVENNERVLDYRIGGGRYYADNRRNNNRSSGGTGGQRGGSTRGRGRGRGSNEHKGRFNRDKFKSQSRFGGVKSY